MINHHFDQIFVKNSINTRSSRNDHPSLIAGRLLFLLWYTHRENWKQSAKLNAQEIWVENRNQDTTALTIT